MLGAAAFLIAEFLKISYFDVILMAVIPTVLYYLSILVMVELDAAKHGGGELMVPAGTLWRLTRDYWFHFGSLVSIVAFMLAGYSPVLAVFWATMLAIALSFLETRYRARPGEARRGAEGRHDRCPQRRDHAPRRASSSAWSR